jgi:hypothetical protein
MEMCSGCHQQRLLFPAGHCQRLCRDCLDGVTTAKHFMSGADAAKLFGDEVGR